MGIPSFGSWLVRKFPGIVEPAGVADGSEYDNLYLDMNSIIHPCFHPKDDEPPTTFDEVFQRVTDYVDMLFALVQPKKLLYMAIDGVAPRAKMNQQRSRRFVAAREVAEAAAEERELRKKFEALGRKLPAKKESEVQDSNIITPGTKFMADLSIALQKYISLRLYTHPAWRNIQVILSDANVPGEGEHKIMSYIRWWKHCSGAYDPNTSHCLYGADADLILLSLATHEHNFSILREAQVQPYERDHEDVPLQFLRIGLLRGRLIGSMLIESPPFYIDFERLIDDFVFICCLVGNDFLPHIPTLVIDDGALDWLMTIYKTEFSRIGDYLTCYGEMNTACVEYFIRVIAAGEESYLRNKYQKKTRLRHKKKRLSRLVAEDYVPDVEVHNLWELEPIQDGDHEGGGDLEQLEVTQSVEELELAKKANLEAGDHCSNLNEQEEPSQRDQAQINLNEKFYDLKEVQEDRSLHDGSAEDTEEDQQERNMEELKVELKSRLTRKMDRIMSFQQRTDKVALGMSGWKTRYYSIKLEVPNAKIDLRANMVLKYVEGLAYILRYYYHGLCSWQWFYPYHYAPFASDFVGLPGGCQFILGEPLRPLEQLMAVLPPGSSDALPQCYRRLMVAPKSPIADFYPTQFSVDYTGDKRVWKGIVKLPFVDERRLIAATQQLQGLLTEEEARRNSFSADLLFVSQFC